MGPQPVNLEEWNITRGILAAECALGMQGVWELSIQRVSYNAS